MPDHTTLPRKRIAIAVLLIIAVCGGAYGIYRVAAHNSQGQSAVTPPGQTTPIADTPSQDQDQSETPCPQGRPPHLLNLGGEDVRVCGDQVDGTVTAISASSIALSAADGETHTFSITASTIITEHGQASTTDDIKTGTTVSVLPADSDANEAGRILINPRFR